MDKEVELKDGRKIKTTCSTKGQEKLFNYYVEISKTDYFQNTILDLRKRYKIPERGFKLPDTSDLLSIFKEPEDWKSQFNKTKDSATKQYSELLGELKQLCKKYNLHYADWVYILNAYLFYDVLINFISPNMFNMCQISDLAKEKKEPPALDNIISNDQFYPIALRISPYATKRDILDYVNKRFSLIKKYQEPYIKTDVKIGKIKKKKKKIQERNDFIYENKNLSINETKKLVEEKFGESLDYEYIGKIRSDEMQKRKEL